MSETHIAVAGAKDAPAIARLTISEAARNLRDDCTAEGLRALLKSMTANATRRRMQEDYRYWLMSDVRGAAAVCAMRGPNHLYHLFVRTDCQGRGLARRLWFVAREDSLARFALTHFTVNASQRAVPVYRRFGFSMEGGLVEHHGIRSQPMRLRLENLQDGLL